MKAHTRPLLSRLAVLSACGLLAAPLLASPVAVTAADEDPMRERLGRDLAAYAGEDALPLADLDELVLWRHALTPEGRAALRQLLDLQVLESLGREAGIEVTQAMLNRRYEEIDVEVRASGIEGGLAQYLTESGVTPDVFRETLKLAIVHEKLARAALGIPDGSPATGEQLSMWLESAIQERGYSEEPHPWDGGVVARCGDVVIGRDAFAEHLREQLPPDILVDACYELLLERRIRIRMPDLADGALERAVTKEIAGRRTAAEANPDYKGLSYESLLEAKGLSITGLQRDPAIRVAALANLWIDRSMPDEELQRVYEAERESFDGRFGEGVGVSVLLLNAAKYKNELIQRSFEEAEAELEKLRARIEGVEDFTRLARLHSEEAASRERGGLLGVVTRESPNVPAPIRRAVFEVLDANEGDVLGRVIGPLRMEAQGASVLLCLGARRPAPTWDTMSTYVHREMRRRFLDDVLAKSDVRTYLDTE